MKWNSLGVVLSISISNGALADVSQRAALACRSFGDARAQWINGSGYQSKVNVKSGTALEVTQSLSEFPIESSINSDSIIRHLMAASRYEIRRGAFDYELKVASFHTEKFLGSSDVRALLEQELNHTFPSAIVNRPAIDNYVRTLDDKGRSLSDLSAFLRKSKLQCRRFGSSSPSKCADGLSAAFNNGFYGGFARIVKRVLTEPKYRGGAARAALEILDLISKNTTEAPTSSNGILELLEKNYLADGVDALRAKEMAWDVVAVYGKLGSSWGLYANEKELISKETVIVTEALSIIFSGVSVLDSLSTGTSYYSIPSSVKLPCAYTDPSNFWETAFLAHLIGDRLAMSHESVYAAWVLANYQQMDGGAFFWSKYKDLDYIRLDIAVRLEAMFYATQSNPKRSSQMVESFGILRRNGGYF